MNITYIRRYCVVVKHAKAIADLCEVNLPESYDPLLFFHSPEKPNTGKNIADVQMGDFKVTISNVGKHLTGLLIPQYTQYQGFRFSDQTISPYENFHFRIEGISIGDTITCEYEYSIPFAENYLNTLTQRIFFHSSYPILNKDLQFIKSKSVLAEISSYRIKEENSELDGKTMYCWHLEDLPACMNESGARPYSELPYVIISLRADEARYTAYGSNESRLIPFHFVGAAMRESRIRVVQKDLEMGVNKQQTILLKKFFKDKTEHLSYDSTGYLQLYNLINYVSEHFTFSDEDIYNRQNRSEKLGNNVMNNIVEYRSRYSLYAALIAGSGLNFYTAYLADCRKGEISEKYFEPVLYSDYLLAPQLNNGEIQYVYPKKSRFGYYLNELPFYYEVSTLLLFYSNDANIYEKDFSEIFISTKPPPRTQKENRRTQSASVFVDIDSLHIHFDVNISLSGQFSTLGRGAYLYNAFDETVNQQYYTRFWESISPEIESESFNVKSISSDFPFKAGFGASFKLDDAMNMKSDTITLDMSGWFNHIVDEHLNADERVMTYYPDFKYTDSYNYMVTFNKKVKVIDRLPILEIKNAYGQLILKCNQQIDGSIMLSSHMTVQIEKVSPDNIHAVEEIQEQLRKLNSMKIRMIVVE